MELETATATPNLAALSETAAVSDDPSVIRRFDNLILSFRGNRDLSIALVYSGTYWFPTVGVQRVQVFFNFRDAELREGSEVKIFTTEPQVEGSNLLGAFADRHECYYYSDIQSDKQVWQVIAVNPRPDGKIHDGDAVVLTNKSYVQQLVPENGWLTTQPNLGREAHWVIRKA